MSLQDHVWPAVLTTLNNLVSVVPPSVPNGWPGLPIKGTSEGEQFAVPETPWLWLINEGSHQVPNSGGSDLEATEHRLTIRLLHEFNPDGTDAEKVLMPLIDQVRQAFRVHLKLGQTTVARALVYSWEWGYLPVGELVYRSVDLTLTATEKEPRSYSA